MTEYLLCRKIVPLCCRNQGNPLGITFGFFVFKLSCTRAHSSDDLLPDGIWVGRVESTIVCAPPHIPQKLVPNFVMPHVAGPTLGQPGTAGEGGCGFLFSDALACSHGRTCRHFALSRCVQKFSGPILLKEAIVGVVISVTHHQQ